MGGSSSYFSISGEHSSQVLPGPNSTTTGPHAVLCALEIVALSFAAAIYKGLAEPSLGVVEVSDHFGLAGTRIWRL